VKSISFSLHHHFIDVTPHPVFAGFERFDEGMVGLMKVFGGVLIFRAVAAAHVTASQAQPQVNPIIPHFQAFFTAIPAGTHLVKILQMSTLGFHARFLSARDTNVFSDAGEMKTFPCTRGGHRWSPCPPQM
jgi:hypothetical protein